MTIDQSHRLVIKKETRIPVLRWAFFLQRCVAYLAVTGMALLHRHFYLSWWQWLAVGVVVVWGSWDHWKLPDEPMPTMRRGVWMELIAVVLMAVVFMDPGILFLLLSPLMRSCMHLSILDSILLASAAMMCSVGCHLIFPTAAWVPWAECLIFIGIGAYTSVIGGLLRQRDSLRRAVTLSAFEREQRIKDEERIHMAARLHDTMGQYWTAVLRALDVAERVDGEQRILFIRKAREAAQHGLREMRESVHDWHEGRRTPDEWLTHLNSALQHVQGVTGVVLQVGIDAVNWRQFEHARDVAEAVCRISLEAVTNAIRHGFANRIRVRLQTGPNELRLVVHDDGRGFADVQWSEEGMGLHSMRRLAEQVGGTLRLESARNHGTTVMFTMPFERA